MDRQISVEPFAPGEYLQEFLEGKGWTQDDLASVLNRTRQHENRLLQGKTAITPDTAHELSSAFDTSAELWMNLQVSYELARAAKENREIAKRAKIFDKVPVREITKRGWIRETNTTDELENVVCEFLRIPNIDEEASLPVAARKSTSYDSDSAAQRAWYHRCLQLAEVAPATRYSERKLEKGIENLKELAAYPEDVRRVPKALADMGIRFVINQHLKSTLIDGVAFWLDKKSPAIAMSLRHGRIDNFWFTLLHEIVHIKYRDTSIVDVDLEGKRGQSSQPNIERRANSEAANYLVPHERIRSLIDRTKPYFYKTRIVQFAQLHGIHPGIVVGQLQHQPDGLEQNQLRKLLVGIRDYVIGQAVTDGWGNTPNI